MINEIVFLGGNSHCSEYEVCIEQYILFFDKLFWKEFLFYFIFFSIIHRAATVYQAVC